MFDGQTHLHIDIFYLGEKGETGTWFGPYYRFYDPRFFFSALRARRIFRVAHQRNKYDLVWTTLPPIHAAVLAAFCCRQTGLPLVADVRDPGIAGLMADQSFMGKLMFVFAKKLEGYVYKTASFVCCTTAESLDFLNVHFRIDRAKIQVISNAAKAKEKTAQTELPRPITVYYGGSFAPYQIVDKVIANLLAHKKERRGLEFNFVGYKDGTQPSLERMVKGEESWLKLRPPVDRAQLLEEMKGAAIIMIPIQGATSELDYAVPLKYYEALSINKPILVVGGTKALNRVTATDGVGVISDPDNGSIIAAANQIATDYKRFVERSTKAVYLRSIEAGKLLKIFAQVNGQK